RGYYYHFKPDIEVEDIAGEKGTIKPHQKEMQNGIEAKPGQLVSYTSGGILRNCYTTNSGKQNHHRTKNIRDKGNSEGRLPAAPMHQLNAFHPNKLKQPNSHSDIDYASDKAERLLNSSFSPEKNQNYCSSQLYNDWQYDQRVIHISSPCGYDSSRSSVFTTLSVRLINIMAKDCNPQLLTIAVSIKAWGMGSA